MKHAFMLLFAICFLFISCVPPLYYYGNYSSTLYKYKKDPGDETLKIHMEELEDIINKSSIRNLQVPPGIYCEYAYLLLVQGESKEALKFIQLEETTYPESATFTNRLRKMILNKTSDTDSSAVKNITEEEE